MSDILEFIKVTESNIDKLSHGISELHSAVQKGGRNPSYWRWKYLYGPAGESTLVVAVRGSRIVGKYGLLYMRMIVKGKPVTAGLMSGLAILPSERCWQCYRGLVEMQIADSRKYNPAFKFGIAVPAVMKLNQRMNVKSLGKIPIYCGIIDAAKILEGRRIPRPLSLAGYLMHPFIGVRAIEKDGDGLDMRPVDMFTGDFDEFWNDIGTKRDICVVKDAKYLNWRYVDCPGYSYGRLAAYKRGRLEGFIVYRNIDSSNSSYIAELLARDDNPLIMKALLSEAFRELKIKGAGYIITSFPADSRTAAVFRELGFKSRDLRYWRHDLMIAASFPGDPFSELDMQDWRFAIGDWVVY